MSAHHPPGDDGATPWIAWAQSIVNGAVGDYLHARENGLGIGMGFYARGRPLPLTREALLHAHPRPTGRLCVLVHGLGCTEGIWAYPDPDRPGGLTSYGRALQADLGYAPLQVRYNTGLAIAQNGRRLAELLAELVAAYPAPVTDLVLIGHSMGGLVIRHACHRGAEEQAPWVALVRQVFYLGSPHDGAPLALLGHLTSELLTAVPNSITRLIGEIVNLRSQGVKDLRSAARPDGHAEPPGPSAPLGAVPWLASAEHYLVFGTLTDDPQHLVAQLLGDGLVLVPDIPQAPRDGAAPFPIPRERVACFPRTDHLQLARDPAVARQIRAWCAAYERSH